MSVNEARLRQLLLNAPKSFENLIRLLADGLDWPVPDGLATEDIQMEWSPEELHLDPAKVASLKHITQIPPLTGSQRTGVFVLDFEGGRLPIGAIRRVVNQLVRRKRATRATNPTWDLADLVFFCFSAETRRVLHVVALRDHDGKRELRTLSWSDDATQARLDLTQRKALVDLAWKPQGPAFAVELDLPDHLTGYRQGIRSAAALSKRMAEVAQAIRDEVRALYEVEMPDGPFRILYNEVQKELLSGITPDRFADVYAQTMVYGLLTSRIAHPERFQADQPLATISFDNAFLDAIYQRFRDQGDDAINVDELGLAALAEDLAVTDVDELLADFGAENQRDDPVIYFYEEFLAQYDPDQRRDLGAFYTPLPVVRYIVKTVDDALKSFGLLDGVADRTTWAEYVAAHPGLSVPKLASPGEPVVAMFDPANGTGTFLMEWLRQGRRNTGEAGVRDALAHASAIEISLASYAVSHLKVSLDLPEDILASTRLPVFLGDSLSAERPAQAMFDDFADPISTEGELADQVKFHRNHTVIIGNPPYDRDASALGGFILAKGAGGRSLFDDILDDAKKYVIFSHTKSLNNLYVYFWRMAIWKAFEVNKGPAVVSMITASSWLTGAGFLGLRRLAREVADDITILDLGGEGRGARQEENIFDIQSPVAIVTLVRQGRGDRSVPARVRYARVVGSRQEKLAYLDKAVQAPVAAEFSILGDDWYGRFASDAGNDGWRDMPALEDLLPWQQPGCQLGRTSPVSPVPEVLMRRWSHFLASPDSSTRETNYQASKTGRNVYTNVAGYARLVDEPIDAPAPPIVRYAYRSFDRQWTWDDPRWAVLERPSLWWSLGEHQIFMATLYSAPLGLGPGATATVAIPDFHYFCGRGGKDIIPLYRDAALTPNADPALLKAVTELHRAADPAAPAVSVERLFAYIFGVLAGTNYTARFHEELATPGPRVPLTTDPGLFARMTEHGRHLLWLQTFGERFADGEGALPIDGVEWSPPPSLLPADRRDTGFEAARGELRVADGVLRGVRPDVYAFEVSGMPVIPKWLGYRMAKPAGRAATSSSPLDKIRPTTWAPDWSRELIEIVAVLTQTLDLLPAGVALLDEICAGPLISAGDLPQPPASLRKPPKTKSGGDDLLGGE